MSIQDGATVSEDLVVARILPTNMGFEEWMRQKVQLQVTRYADERAHLAQDPYDITITGSPTIGEGLLVNTGGNYTLKALRESSVAVGSQPDTTLRFTTAGSFIGVGDSAAAAAVAQTNLQAVTNKVRKAMDATFPLLVGDSYTRANPTTGASETVVLTDRQMAFRTSWGSAEAVFAWNEFCVANHITAGSMLDRFVSAQGTKPNTQVWESTITFTLS